MITITIFVQQVLISQKNAVDFYDKQDKIKFFKHI
jgi:hypothetical protein